MANKNVIVPTLLWYGNKELKLSLPSEWEISVLKMDGYDDLKLSEKEIAYAFSKTIDSKRIRELANTRHEAAIMFDDMTRPTPVRELVPYIVRELNEGGISNDHIRFVSALGAHNPMDREDLVKKLGENIVEEFPVFNHNPFSNLTDLGETTRKTPVKINSEVMSCDLKIGVGLVCPHTQAGFGGGGKVILPGVSSIETILANHKLAVKWGTIGDCLFRLDLEETARIAGLDVKVDTIVNGKAELSSVYVGNFVAEHRVAIERAMKVYAIHPKKKYDVVIANAYMKHNEVLLTVRLINNMIKPGGTAVIVENEPKGPVWHYLEGKFGRDSGGPFCTLHRSLKDVGKVIIHSQFKMKDPWYPLYDPDKQTWMKNWGEVLEELKNRHGNHADVAVIPEATITIPYDLMK
jgi:nickel-dependent lactate racemase